MAEQAHDDSVNGALDDVNNSTRKPEVEPVAEPELTTEPEEVVAPKAVDDMQYGEMIEERNTLRSDRNSLTGKDITRLEGLEKQIVKFDKALGVDQPVSPQQVAPQPGQTQAVPVAEP